MNFKHPKSTQNSISDDCAMKNPMNCSISTKSSNIILSNALSVAPESKVTSNQSNVSEIQKQKSYRKRSIASDYITRNKTFSNSYSKGIEIFDDDSIQFFENLKAKAQENRFTNSKENHEPSRKRSKRKKNLFDVESSKLMSNFKKSLTEKCQKSTISTTPPRGEHDGSDICTERRASLSAGKIGSSSSKSDLIFNKNNFDFNLRSAVGHSSFSNGSITSPECREYNLSRKISVTDEECQDSINIMSMNFTPPLQNDDSNDQNTDLGESLMSDGGDNLVGTENHEYLFTETEMEMFVRDNNTRSPCIKTFSPLVNSPTKSYTYYQ